MRKEYANIAHKQKVIATVTSVCKHGKCPIKNTPIPKRIDITTENLITIFLVGRSVFIKFEKNK